MRWTVEWLTTLSACSRAWLRVTHRSPGGCHTRRWVRPDWWRYHQRASGPRLSQSAHSQIGGIADTSLRVDVKRPCQRARGVRREGRSESTVIPRTSRRRRRPISRSSIPFIPRTPEIYSKEVYYKECFSDLRWEAHLDTDNITSHTSWVRSLIGLEIALWERLDDRLRQDVNITLAIFESLGFVERSGERGLRVGELADKLHLTVGGTSKLVDRMEREGVIRRDVDGHDRRASRVVLTLDGFDRLRRARTAYEAEVATAVDHVLSIRRAHTHVSANGTNPSRNDEPFRVWRRWIQSVALPMGADSARVQPTIKQEAFACVDTIDARFAGHR